MLRTEISQLLHVKLYSWGTFRLCYITYDAAILTGHFDIHAFSTACEYRYLISQAHGSSSIRTGMHKTLQYLLCSHHLYHSTSPEQKQSRPFFPTAVMFGTSLRSSPLLLHRPRKSNSRRVSVTSNKRSSYRGKPQSQHKAKDFNSLQEKSRDELKTSKSKHPDVYLMLSHDLEKQSANAALLHHTT